MSIRLRAEEGRALLTLAFSAKAAARPQCVWSALLRSEHVAHWLPRFEGWSEPPPHACAAGASLRFRSRMRQLPAGGELRILDAKPGRLSLLLRIGLFRFTARVSLGPEPGVSGATRIGLVVTLANEIALVGGSLDRFEARKLACELAEQTLAQLAACAENSDRGGALPNNL